MWVVRQDGSFSRYTTQDGLPSDLVVALMLLPDGSAWVGTRDEGVARFDGKGFPQTYNEQNSGLASNEVRALLAASDGSLWVGTPRGVDRLPMGGKWEHYRAGQPFGADFAEVTDIAEGTKGAIWVSAWGEGGVVYRFAEGSWQRISYEDPGVGLPRDTIQCITAAPDGRVWFGSYYHGAARFDGKDWQQFQVRDGLVYSDVNDIFVDTAGTVWLATTGGLSRFIP
jgi:ligand-binding sensor domain-containing protein